jgi:hypothetical protein
MGLQITDDLYAASVQSPSTHTFRQTRSFINSNLAKPNLTTFSAKMDQEMLIDESDDDDAVVSPSKKAYMKLEMPVIEEP